MLSAKCQVLLAKPQIPRLGRLRRPELKLGTTESSLGMTIQWTLVSRWLTTCHSRNIEVLRLRFAKPANRRSERHSNSGERRRAKSEGRKSLRLQHDEA